MFKQVMLQENIVVFGEILRYPPLSGGASNQTDLLAATTSRNDLHPQVRHIHVRLAVHILRQCLQQIFSRVASTDDNELIDLDGDNDTPVSTFRIPSISYSEFLLATSSLIMTSGLLWVIKDQKSATLSSSSRAETANIRRHVQEARHRPCRRTKGRSRENNSITLLIKKKEHDLLLSGEDRNCCTQDLPDNTSLQNLVWSFLCSIPTSPLQVFPDLEPDERRSLAFFRTRTAHEWAGWRDANFWNTLVLQLAHYSNSVAHCLISIASIHKSLDQGSTLDVRVQLQRLARKQCNKAISTTQFANLTYFEALVTCIIMICLLNLQDNKRHALQLFRSGRMMLADNCSGVRKPTEAPISIYEARLIDSQVRPVFDQLACRMCSMGDASVAYQLSIGDHHSTNEALDNFRVPEKFKSLLEAREALEGIIGWYHNQSYNATNTDPTSVSIRESLHCLFDAWRIAINTLIPQIPEREGREVKKARFLLTVSCIFARLVIDSSCFETETEYDDYTESFDEIIQTIEEIHTGAPPGNVGFGIDEGLVNILAFVGQKCREPNIRRRAAKFLLQGCRKEGDQHGWVGGAILETLIELEEDGLVVNSCSDVAESSRRRIHGAYVFYTVGKLRLLLLRHPYDSDVQSVEQRCVDLPMYDMEMADDGSLEMHVPDVIFGPGYTKLLQDRRKQEYYCIVPGRFFFPIPRV